MIAEVSLSDRGLQPSVLMLAHDSHKRAVDATLLAAIPIPPIASGIFRQQKKTR